MKTNKPKTEPQPTTEMYQSVCLTFEDGSRACFTGKAHVYPGDPNRTKVIKVEIVPPRPMPIGSSFGPIE